MAHRGCVNDGQLRAGHTVRTVVVLYGVWICSAR
jgi:hypothetical protein